MGFAGGGLWVGGASGALIRHGPVDQEAGDGCGGAVVHVEGAVTVALDGEQAAVVQLAGQAPGPGVDGLGIPGDPDDEDRGGALGTGLLRRGFPPVPPASAVGLRTARGAAEEGVGLLLGGCLRIQLGGGGARVGIVVADDRGEHDLSVGGAVHRLVSRLRRQFGQALHRFDHEGAVVVGHRRGEHGGQCLPVRLCDGVLPDDDGGAHCVDGGVGVRGGERVLVQAVDEGGQLGDRLIRGTGQGAGALCLAVLDVLTQNTFIEGVLLDSDLVGRSFRGVHGAVQDCASDVAWEEVGVEGSDVGAVGDAQVVQFCVAVGGAQDVQVAGDVAGADVVEQLRDLGVLGAPGGIGRTPVDPLLGGRICEGEDIGRHDLEERVARAVQVLVDLVIGPAGDGGGLPQAPRVEPDNVVGASKLLPEHGGVGLHHSDAAAAGASGVEEQGAVLGVAV